MNSFSHYTKNNNCNLILKKSLIFSLYNNNIKNKSIYYKTNNEIKGFTKDPILNDFVYFASNGIKKNAIFRKNELILNRDNNNFVSFFYNIEDNLSVFNLYPQKYASSIITKFNKDQKVFYNWKHKSSVNSDLNTYFLTNYKILNENNKNLLFLENNKQIFIKNYYNKYYFINSNGFIKGLDNKLFQKNLFSGLLYVLPMKIQRNLKQLFSLNLLILNYLSQISNLTYKNITFKINLVLYTLYLKYINYTVGNYFSLNKIKIRKSNWLLYRYIKIYLEPTNKLINFLYVSTLNKITKFNNFFQFNQILYSDQSLYRKKEMQLLNKMDRLPTELKVKMIENLLNYLYINYSDNYSFMKSKKKLLFKYVGYKSLLIWNFKNHVPKIIINNNNYLNYLNFQIKNLNNNLTNNNFFSLNPNIINWNIGFNNIHMNLNRNFLNFKKTKDYITFNKSLIKNKYLLACSYKEINDLKKNINKFKRFFSKRRRNLNKNVKTNYISMSRSKQLKSKNIKKPLFKYYNIINLKKINSTKTYVYK